MKIELNTYRYGQETTLLYHGTDYEYREDTALLVVSRPTFDNGKTALAHYVTLTNTDDFVVADCEPDEACAHPSIALRFGESPNGAKN